MPNALRAEAGAPTRRAEQALGAPVAERGKGDFEDENDPPSLRRFRLRTRFGRQDFGARNDKRTELEDGMKMRKLMVMAAVGVVAAGIVGAAESADSDMNQGFGEEQTSPTPWTFQPGLMPGPFTPTRLQAPVPPPPLKEEVIPGPTGPNFVWTPGNWSWTGRRWEWVSGGWVRRPRPRAEWVPGYWNRVSRTYRWVSGYWR